MRATLSTDETNLSKASIRSPINGVVLTRSVEPGNAVAASLQAVTLFTVAEDIAHLRAEVSVDEADVGSVKVGQKASFTVSAYPPDATRHHHPRGLRLHQDGQRDHLHHLPGCGQRRLEPAPRHDGSGHHRLHRTQWRAAVPNTALALHAFQRSRWRCPSAAPTGQHPVGGVQTLPCMPRPAGARRLAATWPAAKQIWVLKDGQAVAVAVQPGISDGRMTEGERRRLE